MGAKSVTKKLSAIGRSRRKRRSVNERRLSRLNRIAVKLLDRADIPGLSKLADRYEDYDFPGEALFLRNKVKRLRSA